MNNLLKLGLVALVGYAVVKTINKDKPVEQASVKEEPEVETTVSVEVTEKRIKQFMYGGIIIIIASFVLGMKYGFNLERPDDHTKYNDYNRETITVS